MCYKFHGSNDFEAMKAGKLAIWAWLNCQYFENMLWTFRLPWGRIKNDPIKSNIIYGRSLSVCSVMLE